MLLSVSPGATTCMPEVGAKPSAAATEGAVTAGAVEAIRVCGGVSAALPGVARDDQVLARIDRAPGW